MFHFSRINIILLKSFYYCSTMAPIFISPKTESPVTRACLQYAPWTVLIVARSIQSWIRSLNIKRCVVWCRGGGGAEPSVGPKKGWVFFVPRLKMININNTI